MYGLLIALLVSCMRVSYGVQDSISSLPFDSVKNVFGVSGETLPRHQTTLLIRNVLYRVRCDQTGADCKKCLNVDSVFSYLNRSRERTLDDASFKKLSLILVVFMTDVENECSRSHMTITRSRMSLKDLFGRLSGNQPNLSLKALMHILTAINENYRFGSLVLDSEGVVIPLQSEVVDFTTDFQCFSPNSLYNSIQKPVGSELNIKEGQLLASYIVLNVLKGHCISTDDKPSPYTFLADLLSVFGDKAKAMLDHEEFENLLEALNLGPQKHAQPNPTTKTKRALHMDKMGMNSTMGRQLSMDMAMPEALGTCLQRNCYTAAETLLGKMRNISAILNETNLQEVYPTVIDSLLSSLWIKTEDVTYETATLSQAYGYGALATGIISISPVVGVFLLQITCLRVKSYIMSVLMALSVSALTGDAILHLLPQATGLKSKTPGGVLDGLPINLSLLKLTAILGSFYIFTSLQMALGVIQRRHSYDVNPDSETSATAEKFGQDTEQEAQNTGLVGMVILGDAVHNFIDGLALGAAFTAGVSSGLSTSIAILCHELPHELGDFSTLMAAGLAMKKAFIMTFASGIAAFIGLAVGVPLAGNTGGKDWAFVFTAGIFLYVSLANVIPELMKQVLSSSCVWLTIVLVNIGMLVGYGAMFAIAAFEEHISV